MFEGRDRRGLTRSECGEKRGIRGQLRAERSVSASGRALCLITIVRALSLFAGCGQPVVRAAGPRASSRREDRGGAGPRFGVPAVSREE